jgi:hypothetical protein
MYMYDAACEIKNCVKITRGQDTYCQVCRRHLCRAHYDRKRHLCRYEGRVSHDLETMYDTDSVARLVSGG